MNRSFVFRALLLESVISVTACTPERATLVQFGAASCSTGHDAASDAHSDATIDAMADALVDASFLDSAPDGFIDAHSFADVIEASVDTGPHLSGPGHACSVSADCEPFPGESSGSMPCSHSICVPVKHVIVIMQENRSFDSYFGTYPGADGIPMSGSVPTVCNYDIVSNRCVPPYHDTNDVNTDPPHSSTAPAVNGGAMDGFISVDEVPPTPIHASASNTSPIVMTSTAAHGLVTGNSVYQHVCTGAPNANGMFRVTVTDSTHYSLNGTTGSGTSATCTAGKITVCNDPLFGGCTHDVMGYHDRTELPQYWAMADWGVLHDHMYASVTGNSAPEHAAIVSGFAAGKIVGGNCVLSTGLVTTNYDGCWTPLTHLLHEANVSWSHYWANHATPHCSSSLHECPPTTPNAGSAFWNSPSYFDTTHDDGDDALAGENADDFFVGLHTGNIPKMVWIIPGNNVSEHPTNKVSYGQRYVTGVINAIAQSPVWWTSAIFISWDEWGGRYDHAPPPHADNFGLGIRVPGLLISPYARAGFIDHQVTSHDAYLKIAEDILLGGQRLDPATDGRPDPRPDVRENLSVTGDLWPGFDFTQDPRVWTVLSQ